ncbi:hypothetical protein [Streptomyces sp. NPDC086787]|uniref:hypothetical protein n=1 Tax=Streptomyces sp. NPDC086787 TaxID=3365759 RepID=UPI003820E6FD
MEYHPFPDDLVQLQVAWHRAYAALAAPHPAGYTLLRRRLLILSGRLLEHPYWNSPAGTPAARVELRHQAHARETRP